MSIGKTIAVILVNSWIWGIFSSEKKAKSALKAWKQSEDFGRIVVYELDYRLYHAPAKYASDKILRNMGWNSPTYNGHTTSTGQLLNDEVPIE